MTEQNSSSRGKLLYFPLLPSVRKDEQALRWQQYQPQPRPTGWLTAAWLGGRPRLITIDYVEQRRALRRGGGGQKIWVAALLSHTDLPPLRLTPRLCRELAALIGLPHPRHWVGHSVWLVPHETPRGAVMVVRGQG
jgi:hypothetical protein